ncbi:hypothetical protein HanIR_Chr07g0338941 [Helianthus annuus]|nr:hypothetical protein HanIR_Chr07g0338941 [Helianthus annuus]
MNNISGLKHGELTSQDEARKQIRIRTLKVMQINIGIKYWRIED